MNRAEQRERTSKLVTELHSIAKLGAKRLLAQLEDPESDLNPFMLNAITGTAVDKIAKYENWEKKGPGDAGDWVKALVDGLQKAGGGRVSLEVETAPAPVEVKVIDVPRVAGVIEASYEITHREGLSPEALEKKRASERLRQQKVRDRKRAEWEKPIA